MRRPLLKQQPILRLSGTKGTGQKSATPATLTKVILVLLTMFLLPSAAWGQDPAIEIIYSSEVGKLWFRSESASKVIYQWDNDNGTPKEYTIGSGADNGSPVQAGTLTYWANGDEDNKFTIIYYGLIIGNTPLTNNNVDGEGAVSEIEQKISFKLADESTSTPATLTLDNANFGPSLDGIIWCGNGALKIQFSGNSIINTRSGSALNADNGYCILGKSSSDLILSASNNASTLTLSPNNGGSGNSRAAISGFTSVSLDDGWGMYYTDDYTTVGDENLNSPNAGKEVIISNGKPLGLSVGGVVVTEKNNNDILGDGKVSFTSATLTLDGAAISGNIESNISPLTVYLKGSSTITPSKTSDAPFQYTGTESTATLTFESSEADDGELTLGGTFSKVETGESGEKYFQFSSGNYTYSNSICPWYVRTDHQYNRHTYTYWGVKDENQIFYNAHYGITIDDYEVTKFNKENVTGDNYDFAYFPDDNYLIVPDNISHTSSFEIKSHRAELNIRISGDCAVKAIKFDGSKTDEFGTLDSKVLNINIDRSSTSTPGKNTLTIDTESSEPAISGFTTVNISENLHFEVPATAPAAGYSYPSKVVLSDEEVYDLWVEGQQVTSRNKDNVKGETIDSENPTPSVVFDSETSTLNLTNANIIVTTSNENLNGGVVSGLENLTVKFKGSNSIKGSGVTTFYGFKKQGDKTCNITFTASESFDFMAETEPEYAVSGFSKVTYTDDLGAFTDNGCFYICKELSLSFDTTFDDNDNPIGVKIMSGGEIVSHKIIYAIDYAKDDMEDIPETEYSDAIPFATITAGPCIFTAYTLSLDGENTKSNNLKYYYFQYSDSEVIIGNGTTIDLKDYLLPTLTGDDEVDLFNNSEQSGSIISINENSTLTGIAYGTAIVTSRTEGVSTFTFDDFGYELSIKVTVQDIIDESTFASGQNYATFYNTDQAYNVPEGLKAYIIKNVDEEKGEIVTEETSVLPPNTPVLLYRTSTSSSANYVFTEVSGVKSANTVLLYTTTEKTAEGTSKLYVLYNDQFVKVTAGTKILANHCYLNLANSAGTRGFYSIGAGIDGTSAIDASIFEELSTEGDVWYDLQGRRIAKPTKAGLYILNGKKIVVK